MSKDKKKKKKGNEVVEPIDETNISAESEHTETAETAVAAKVATKLDKRGVSKMAKRKAVKYKAEYNTLQMLWDWADDEYSRLEKAYYKKTGSRDNIMELAKTDAKKLKLLEVNSADLAEIVGAMKELDRLIRKIENRQRKIVNDD